MSSILYLNPVSLLRMLCTQQCTPDISQSLSPNNSRQTSIDLPLGRDIGVSPEFDVCPKFYVQSCAGWNIVLYCAALYRASMESVQWIGKLIMKNEIRIRIISWMEIISIRSISIHVFAETGRRMQRSKDTITSTYHVDVIVAKRISVEVHGLGRFFDLKDK